MTASRDLVNPKKWSWHNMDARNEKSVLKVAKWPSLRPLALKSEFLLEFEFLKKLQRLVSLTSNFLPPKFELP